jgi:methylisocitrate lyase
MGYQMVIFPVTALRVTLKALDGFYKDLIETGTQAAWMEKMVTRDELYERVGYEDFTAKGGDWSNPTK